MPIPKHIFRRYDIRGLSSLYISQPPILDALNEKQQKHDANPHANTLITTQETSLISAFYNVEEKTDSQFEHTQIIPSTIETAIEPVIEIDARFVHALGRVLARYFKEHGHYSVLVAYDTRKYSVQYHDILCAELNACGCDVISLGLVPTPCLYFAVHFLQTHAGIMVTASHNDAPYNGFKIWEGKRTLCGEEIQDIYRRMCSYYTEQEAKGVYCKITGRKSSPHQPVSKELQRARTLVNLFAPSLYSIVHSYMHGAKINRKIGGLTSAFKIKMPYIDALCTQVINAFPSAFLPVRMGENGELQQMTKEELHAFLNRRSPIFSQPHMPDNGLRRRNDDLNALTMPENRSPNDASPLAHIPHENQIPTMSNSNIVHRGNIANSENYISLNTGIQHEANKDLQSQSEEMSFASSEYFHAEYFNKEYQKYRRGDEWEKHVKNILTTTPVLSQKDLMKLAYTIVVDGGNGTAGDLFCDVLREVTMKTGFIFNIIPLHCTPSSDFPNHPPDPTVKENCHDLCNAIIENNADYGIALDGDGDRMVLVDKNARIIESDVLLSILARDVLLRIPGARILADVKCSQNFFKEVESLGGVCIVAPTGHSMMKASMLEKEAHLGGEFSGHFFHARDFSRKKIRDVELLPFRSAFFHSPFTIHKESPPVQIDWFGTDDGLLSALRVLAVLLERGWDLTQFPVWPKSFASPEIHFHCPDEQKDMVMERVKKHFTEKYKLSTKNTHSWDLEYSKNHIKHKKNTPLKITTIDGLRVDFDGAWFLVRPSHTTDCLTLRFEAKNEEDICELEADVTSALNAIMADASTNT